MAPQQLPVFGIISLRMTKGRLDPLKPSLRDRRTTSGQWGSRHRSKTDQLVHHREVKTQDIIPNLGDRVKGVDRIGRINRTTLRLTADRVLILVSEARGARGHALDGVSGSIKLGHETRAPLVLTPLVGLSLGHGKDRGEHGEEDGEDKHFGIRKRREHSKANEMLRVESDVW